MALDKFQPYLFVSAGEQSNKYLTPVISPDGIAAFQAQRAQDLAGLTIRIDPIQEGTGDPSPDNIRPISGRTGANIIVAGKNLATGNITRGLLSITIGSSIDDVTPSNRYGYTERYPARSGLTVTISSDNLENLAAFFVLMYNNGILAAQSGAKTFTAVGTEMTYTVPADTYDTVVLIIGADASHATPLTVDGQLQVEVGSASTAYEPYRGQVYPITWQEEAGTVYGGTLDVVSGVLTVDSYYYEVPANSVMQASSGGYQYFATPNRPIGAAYSEAPIGLYCNRLPSVMRSATRTNAWGIAYDTGVDRLQMKLQDITTQEDAQTWVANNPLQIVYKLATPQTYQLTPTEVRTIAGYNQVYSDAGPVIDIQF